MTERTIALDDMPYEPWPSVHGIARGDIVVGVEHGRRFRVVETDSYVQAGRYDEETGVDTRTATGPYCELQALDDRNCKVMWPRDWYMPAWLEALI